MRFFYLISVLLSSSLLASETAVIYDHPSITDVRFVFTDPMMNTAADKYFSTTTCQLRFQAANSVRENIVTQPCKAEAIKFILNSGYKNIDRNIYAK